MLAPTDSTYLRLHSKGSAQANVLLDQACKVLDAKKCVKYQLGEAEDAEMKRNFPEGGDCSQNSCARHKWFRKFDKRRYSMFYHRYQSYLLALEYAKSNGFEYDWFVMARFVCYSSVVECQID